MRPNWSAERLTGRAILDVALAGKPSALLPLAPCNVAIGKARWGSHLSPLLSGEGLGVRADQASETEHPQISKFPDQHNHPPDPVPKEEAASDHRAALGSGGDGRRGSLGRAVGPAELRVVARRTPGSERCPRLLVRDAGRPGEPVVHRIAKRLRAERRPGTGPGKRGGRRRSRRWRIELGGNDRFHLRLVRAGPARPRRQLALLRESRTYDCSLRGVDVSAQWKLQVYNEPLEQVTRVLDPDLQLVSARLGDVVDSLVGRPGRRRRHAGHAEASRVRSATPTA